jgi:hypothetical protein
VNVNKTEEEVQDECPAFDNNLDLDANNIEIEEGDCILMVMVYPVDPEHFVYALSMVSRCLAEAFAKTQSQRDSTRWSPQHFTPTKMCSAK